jgi:hypothetical protein
MNKRRKASSKPERNQVASMQVLHDNQFLRISALKWQKKARVLKDRTSSLSTEFPLKSAFVINISAQINSDPGLH